MNTPTDRLSKACDDFFHERIGRAALAEAVLTWLAEDDDSAAIVRGMLHDTFASLAAQGRLAARPDAAERAAPLVAALEGAWGRWDGQNWRRAQVAGWFLGKAPVNTYTSPSATKEH